MVIDPKTGLEKLDILTSEEGATQSEVNPEGLGTNIGPGTIVAPAPEVGDPSDFLQPEEEVVEDTPLVGSDLVVDIDEEKAGDIPDLILDRKTFKGILAKKESDQTDAEKALLREFKAGRALGETSAQIFGEGVAEGAAGVEGETLIGEQDLGSFLGKVSSLNDAMARSTLSSVHGLTPSQIEQVMLRRGTQASVGAKQEDVDLRLTQAKSDIENRGQERMNTLDRSLSFSGFGRSTAAVQKRDELQVSINNEIRQAQAKADLEVQLFKAQQEGAEAETISSIRTGLANATAKLKETETENAIALAKSNQELGLKADEALDAFLNGTAQGIEAKDKGFDQDASLALGYVSDKFGNPLVTGDDGNPLAFTGNEFGQNVKISQFKDANDNTYVYKNGVLDSIIDLNGNILKGDQLKSTKVPAQVQEDKKQEDQRKLETQLRNEFIKRPESKRFQEIRAQFERVKQGSAADSAAGDIALVFSFMKMLDPGSVVRESEFATAENSQGVPDKVRNGYNKLLSGKRFGDNKDDLAIGLRADMLQRSKDLFDSELLNFNTTRDSFSAIAEDAGARPEFIFTSGEFGEEEEFKLEADEETELDSIFGASDSQSGTGDFTSSSGKSFNIIQDSELKDFNIGDPTSGTKVGISNIGLGTVTQKFGATSPLTIDNVKLANGSVGTPGIDIDGKIGDPIPSPISGTVKDIIKSSTGLGNRVVIVDEKGNEHFFNHLSQNNVKKGQSIKQGQIFGSIGNSGSVIKGAGGDGSHLDYRVKSTEGWIDPNDFLNS